MSCFAIYAFLVSFWNNHRGAGEGVARTVSTIRRALWCMALGKGKGWEKVLNVIENELIKYKEEKQLVKIPSNEGVTGDLVWFSVFAQKQPNMIPGSIRAFWGVGLHQNQR